MSLLKRNHKEIKMSMNLHLYLDGVEYSLQQTPTHITNMCMMTSKGIVHNMTGKQAKRAIRIYLEYVRGKLSGVIDTEDPVIIASRDVLHMHIAFIANEVDNATHVEVKGF